MRKTNHHAASSSCTFLPAGLTLFSAASALVFTLLLGWGPSGCTADPGPKTEPSVRPVDLVYPFLDAANSRWFFFSSACRPFGMVTLNPDTQLGGAWGSGYRYETDTIKGFSHIHAWQLSGVSVMPVVSQGRTPEAIFADYYSKFDHANEEAKPGYHRVQLDRYGITAELTSTTRVGFHRYRFPDEEKNSAVVFQLAGVLGPSDIINGQLRQTGKRTLEGQVVNAPTRRRPKDATVFFTATFNQDVDSLLLSEAGDKAMVFFTANASGELLMKVAISYTSVANASRNLEIELPGWEFEQIVADSQKEWNDLLSRIQVEGPSVEDQKRFYTDLWHALQGRRIISDAEGYYPDNTGSTFQVKQLPLDENGRPRFNHYNSDSFWGAQWTINTLWHLVYPEITQAFVNSLLQYYQDGGLVPRGPSGGNYTYVMTGASSTPFIVSAYQKGIRGFDINLAYEGLKKNHLPGGIMARAGYEHDTQIGGGLEDYLAKGYVPHPNPKGRFGFHQDGASLTMEYAYQDWTLAQLAKALGKEEDYAYFLNRSNNYKNTFDTEVGWMRPKDVNGAWRTPYDPYEYENGFNESNGSQSTWFVPHDLPGLAELMGGREAAIQKLQTSFEEAAKLGFTSGSSHDRETHPEYRRVPINYGNQPSMQTAFVFHHLGRPDLTQYWSRQVANTVYRGLTPDRGYSGDEDQGLMGSLAVLLKIGLFQMTGGTEADPGYEIGSPIFDKITIQLHPDFYPGKMFIIQTENNAEDHPYVQAARWHDEELQELSLRHSEIIQGGTLILQMSGEK